MASNETLRHLPEIPAQAWQGGVGGCVLLSTRDRLFLQRADYTKPKSVKKLLWNMDKLARMAIWHGNSVAHSIWLDLREALVTPGVLTEKQERYLRMWLDGYTQMEIGAKHRIARHGVSQTIDKGIKNMSRFLNT